MGGDLVVGHLNDMGLGQHTAVTDEVVVGDDKLVGVGLVGDGARRAKGVPEGLRTIKVNNTIEWLDLTCTLRASMPTISKVRPAYGDASRPLTRRCLRNCAWSKRRKGRKKNERRKRNGMRL